ncbi:unnamed protein product [Rotaria magnacalcarata]|uniref:RING-type domain-containing protein n=1 Tax=Rotaria magnacalcarata TaxID=392030 RepID=A0A816ZXW2_9BILA|nr:unnamed protein product [Rotaria magnacalcarata]CAF2231932.1 unnamed protein product [Rotaria magnacalcarata]CAF3887592.1 unnamed protein product [Rotaria magnacalcarata]CAF3894404.1 unnamed protein product [Rotaria magnacalcarata]
MVINVAFTNIVGKTIQTQLPDNFTFDDFKNLVIDKIDSTAVEHYRFVANNKDLCLDSKDEFTKRKHLIKNGTTIFLLRRMNGGGYVETAILIDIIIQELPKELPKLRMHPAECVVCLDDKQCMKICCTVICMTCFPRYFKEHDLQVKCMICPQQIPYAQFFVSPDFIRSLDSLNKIRGLMKHIDCQICHCGSLLVNETLFAQQTCTHCQRTFCFFCNKDWKDGPEPRHNQRFTCGVNCDYEMKLNYDLIPYVQNKAINIPNSRICPKCFNVGGYDGKCKYHQCVVCKHTFCFLCLAPKVQCYKEPSSIQQLCAEVKRQEFNMFPRIANS